MLIILQIILLNMIAASIVCIVFSLREKRRNMGYVVTTILVVVADFLCLGLLYSRDIRSAKTLLIGIYTAYALAHVTSGYAVMNLQRDRKWRWIFLPCILLSAYQIVILLASISNLGSIRFAKHIFLGQNWWVAESYWGGNFFLSMGMYYLLILLGGMWTSLAMAQNSSHEAKVFRSKYLGMFGVQIVLIAFGVAIYVLNWPIWIQCILFSTTSHLIYIFQSYYPKYRLRSWALTTFANEMSDGFILFNEHDDLIYMNNCVRNLLESHPTMNAETVTKDEVEAWTQDTVEIANEPLMVCVQGEKERIFHVYTQNLRDVSSGVGTIYLFRDMTDAVARIRMMENTNYELARTAKMKSDFLANMSHEIRTPMNAVIGMAELAMREELPPHVVDYLTQIRESGRNLLNIINDILDFSKIEAGKMEIVPGPYQPITELNDITNILATRIVDKPLELFAICDPDVPHELMGDSMRIRQILINLVNNAIKFTGNGIVIIRVSCEWLSKDRVRMLYHVIDNGQGIREEDLAKLFVSFQQVDAKRNRLVEGTGLGLAISKSLCEAMGGTIDVNSRYGEGSDFYFSIPQQVLDSKRDLVVEHASEKYVCCLCEDEKMVGAFVDELSGLHVEAGCITALSEYKPVKKHNYVFVDEKHYNVEFLEFMDAHPEVTGVVLVPIGSGLRAERPNIHVMHRPETTMNMVMTLNGQYLIPRTKQMAESYVFNYTAPDARILVVDDNVLNIRIVKGLLQPIGLTVVGVESGAEAIQAVEKEEYDLILMDHMMPGMDGIEATKIIRGMKNKSHMPILALSANVLEEERKMFLREGMDDFIPKPIEVRVLGETVRNWLPSDKIHNMYEKPKEEREVNVSAFHGLDREAALETLGSETVYRMVLEEYYRGGMAHHHAIEEAYKQEDLDAYQLQVHSLKSASKQIGAMKLGRLSEELEKAAKEKQKDIIAEKTPLLLVRYKALLEELATEYETDVTQEGAPDEVRSWNEAEIMPILEGIREACENLDLDGLEEGVACLKAYRVPENLAEMFEALYTNVEGLDTEACLSILEELQGRMNVV